jgi:hypothetical protein
MDRGIKQNEMTRQNIFSKNLNCKKNLVEQLSEIEICKKMMYINENGLLFINNIEN